MKLTISSLGDQISISTGEQYVTLDADAAWEMGMTLLKKSCFIQGLRGPLVVIKPGEEQS